MSSSKSKEDEVVVGDGVLTITDGVVEIGGNIFFCGNSQKITKTQTLFGDKESEWWNIFKVFFHNGNKQNIISWQCCNFVKITNIYNQVFIYVSTTNSGVKIYPFTQELNIDVDGLILANIKKYLDDNGIEYDNEAY